MPARVRRKDIAIRPARMAVRRGTGRTAQDELIAHEFAVVFAQWTCGRVIAGIADVGPAPLSSISDARLIVNWLPFSATDGARSGAPPSARLDGLSIAVSTSLASRNEPGNAGLHNSVKPDPQLNSFANLLHGLFREGGDFEVFLDPAGGLRSG